MPSEDDKKKAPGTAEKKTVLKLEPVSFQLTVYYLGHDRIKHDAATYRCKYELLKEASAATPAVGNTRADPATSPVQAGTAAAVIENCIREKAATDPLAKPALPVSRGGDNSHPANDIIYRLLVVDNHAVSKGDLNNVLGGGPLSKQKSYSDNRWMPAISPAVPFRAVVKKFVGTSQVPVTENLELVIELKDPIEEADQNNGARRTFLKGFFEKYNRTSANPNPGDDNALKSFGGIRAPNAAFQGAKAQDLLKKVPYKSPPAGGLGATPPNSITYASLSAVNPLGSSRAVVPLEIKDDGPQKIGVADLAFLPPPVSGDNYRFLFFLRGKADPRSSDATADIRDQKVNGMPVKLLDDSGKEVKPKCCYTTGRFVLWRKIQFRMIVLCNGLAKAGIDWASIATTYRKYFIELEAPQLEFTITWELWRDGLQKRYHTTPATDPWFSNDAQLQTQFARGLIPGTFVNAVTEPGKFRFDGTTPSSLKYSFDLDPDIHALTRHFVQQACSKYSPMPSPALVNPDGNDQSTTDGMYVFFAKRLSPDTNDGTLGEYIGDRIFYMYPSTPVDTTDTCAHELGHALYLSHSCTKRLAMSWGSAGGPVVNIVEASFNCAIHDHDQNDACTCLMSYTSSSFLLNYPYDHCGACGLGLRFYDKTKFQQGGNYGKEMMAPVKPASIVRLDYINNFLDTAIPNLAVGSDVYLVAVGAQKNWPKPAAAVWPARIGISGLANLTKAGVGPTPGDVDLGTATHRKILKVYKVTGKTIGRVKLSYSHQGITAETEFNVV